MLGDRAGDDVDEGRPVGVAVPGNDAARLHHEPAQPEHALVGLHGFLRQVDGGQHLVGHVLRHRGALLGEVDAPLVGRALPGERACRAGAMKILEAQGIIVSNPRRSVHVVAFDHGKIEQIARVRVAIERIAFAEATAVYSSNPALLTELDQIIQQMEQQARLDDLNGVTTADLAFHRAVCTASR